MSASILLALGAMVAGAFADLIYKGAQNKGINAGTFIFYQSFAYTGTIWLVGLFTGQVSKIIQPAWIYGLPAGLAGYIGLFLFIQSLKEGHATVNVPIFRLSFVVTSIGAIFLLGESVTWHKVVGTLLAIAGVLSLANLAALRRGGLSKKALAYLLTATLAQGIMGILAKQATNEGCATIPLMLVQTITFNAGSFTYILTSRKWHPNITTLQFAPFVGFLQLAWMALLYQSLQIGDASISFPIVQLSFVLTAILAIIILREVMNQQKLLGLSAATLAVASFALG